MMVLAVLGLWPKDHLGAFYRLGSCARWETQHILLVWGVKVAQIPSEYCSIGIKGYFGGRGYHS